MPGQDAMYHGLSNRSVMDMLINSSVREIKKEVATAIFKEIDTWRYGTKGNVVCLLVDKRLYEGLKDRFLVEDSSDLQKIESSLHSEQEE